MDTTNTTSKTIENYGILNAKTHWNLSPEALIDICVQKGLGQIASNGALMVDTGEFTGRSPQDRFIVKDAITKDKVWWGNINLPFDEDKFEKLYNKLIKHLSGKELYARDAYACADEKYRMNIRMITELPWSNLFVYNMFLRPSEQELKDFKPEWTILQAPSFMAIAKEDGTRQHNFAILNFSKKVIIIGGTGYTGEVKKGIFSALNFILPVFKETLPMHCSANVGENGETAIFFGLSGTGKTTLSADPNRKLIGDDEHGWTKENTIFNFEGGCYAKVINLTEENEPDIYRAIRPGAILENVVCKQGTNEVDYTNTSITQNTRVSYPIHFIDNIQVPSLAKNPKNIFFLTADAFGVLPPISKLTPGQAAYHFISGYTAKVAGTEAGIDEPLPSFSACFGAPFMPLHPTVYAEMLSTKMKETKVNVWLINTGWTGGAYGVGSRIKLKYTRAMITAAINGELGDLSGDNYHIHTVFGLAQVKHCPGVPDDILSQRQAWNDDEAFYKQAHKLADAFRANFEKFAEYANEEILAGGPPIINKP